MLDNPYTRTQNYLITLTGRLSSSAPPRHFHIFNYFLLPEQRSSMRCHIPQWCFSPTCAHGSHTFPARSTAHPLLGERGLSTALPQQNPPALKSSELQAPCKTPVPRYRQSLCTTKTQKSHLVLQLFSEVWAQGWQLPRYLLYNHVYVQSNIFTIQQ